MASNKTVICRYPHCKHETRELLKDEAVREGRVYYHKDCFATREAVRKVEEFYIENFDKDPIYGQLRKVINELVFDKGHSPEYILYTLQYAKSKDYNLRSPIGMFYLARDYKIEDAWKKQQAEKAAANLSSMNFNIQSSYEKVDGYTTIKDEGFGRVVG